MLYKEYIDELGNEYLHIRVVFDWLERLRKEKIEYRIYVRLFGSDEIIDVNLINLKWFETAMLFPAFLPKNGKSPYYL
jgi:hypothetical protein